MDHTNKIFFLSMFSSWRMGTQLESRYMCINVTSIRVHSRHLWFYHLQWLHKSHGMGSRAEFGVWFR